MAYQKSALVTGGAGFIGSHLVDRLVEEDYRVIIVDDLSSGKLKNLNHQANFHHMSISQPSLGDVLNRERPDLVFHLAAQSSVSRSVRIPSSTTKSMCWERSGCWRRRAGPEWRR